MEFLNAPLEDHPYNKKEAKEKLSFIKVMKRSCLS